LSSFQILLSERETVLHPKGFWLDDFVPVCQFRELHGIRVHAPADAVFRAVKSVTAGEIRFFRLLT
jgi:hypothetical protein